MLLQSDALIAAAVSAGCGGREWAVWAAIDGGQS